MSVIFVMVSVSNHPERVEGTRPQTCDFFVAHAFSERCALAPRRCSGSFDRLRMTKGAAICVMAIVDKTPTSPYAALFLSQLVVITSAVTSFLPRWRHFCHGERVEPPRACRGDTSADV